jgi:hypothetical protein
MDEQQTTEAAQKAQEEEENRAWRAARYTRHIMSEGRATMSDLEVNGSSPALDEVGTFAAVPPRHDELRIRPPHEEDEAALVALGAQGSFVELGNYFAATLGKKIVGRRGIAHALVSALIECVQELDGTNTIEMFVERGSVMEGILDDLGFRTGPRVNLELRCESAGEAGDVAA